MLQFLQVIETNAFALEEPTYAVQKNLLSRNKEAFKGLYFCVEKHQIGTALYNHVSRFNHSCDPNVAFIFHKHSQKIILYSARFIEKEEELNLSYGPVYHITKVFMHQNMQYDSILNLA